MEEFLRRASQPPHQSHLSNLAKSRSKFSTLRVQFSKPSRGFAYPRMWKRTQADVKQKQTNVGKVLATWREPRPLLPLPAPAIVRRLHPRSSWPKDECHLSESPIPPAPAIYHGIRLFKQQKSQPSFPRWHWESNYGASHPRGRKTQKGGTKEEMN